MKPRNPTAAEHADNVVAFLQSAEEQLDAAKEAFEGGDMAGGWEYYLDAFREIGRAQQEVLNASDTEDDGILDVLDQANARINELDAVVRRGLAYRIGVDVPLEYIFETAPPTAVLARADVIGVPIGDWEQMRAHIVNEMIRRYGSVRKAAPVIGVSRSTLQSWAKSAAV